MGHKLKLLSLTAGASALSIAMAAGASATGTAADTTVKNTFTLDYTVGTTPQPTISTCKIGDAGCGTETSTNFTVDRLIDLTVASNGDENVDPSEIGAELIFSVTNTGNDTQAYELSLFNEAGDDFDASGLTMVYYFDDGTAGFGAGDLAGTAYSYTLGTPTEDLPQDTIIWVVVSGNIPAAGAGAGEVEDGDEADVTLAADTLEPSTSPNAGDEVFGDTDGNTLTGAAENVLADDAGTETTGDFDGPGTATGDNAGDGAHSATGTFIVNAATLSASKAVTVFSQDGTGCETFPGTPTGGYSVPEACMEYVITVTNTGTSTAATGIDLTDVLESTLRFSAAQRSANLTGGTFATPATNADCSAVTCTVALSGASLAAGETGTVTIRAYIQ